ncbi:MAG TPA: hypothetical protein DCF97_01320 [Plesiomonas shigelloides]|nr:hypothetical protein [Plesiomonas shigelloides]
MAGFFALVFLYCFFVLGFWLLSVLCLIVLFFGASCLFVFLPAAIRHLFSWLDFRFRCGMVILMQCIDCHMFFLLVGFLTTYQANNQTDNCVFVPFNSF